MGVPRDGEHQASTTSATTYGYLMSFIAAPARAFGRRFDLASVSRAKIS
jgi:hypothetical protein